MPEHRIHITVSEHGYDLENGERFLKGFTETHPEVGPSVSQNTADGTLSVTLSLDAEDANEAFELSRPIFVDGAYASGLDVTQIVGVEVSLVPAEEYDPEQRPEPVPA